MAERSASAGAPGELDEFQLLIGAIADYAIFRLDSEGRVASWNLGAQRIKGYAGDEIIGQHFSRFYTEADRAAGLPALALSQAAEHGAYSAEGWRRRKDGTLFWGQMAINAIHDGEGRVIGFA